MFLFILSRELLKINQDTLDNLVKLVILKNKNNITLRISVLICNYRHEMGVFDQNRADYVGLHKGARKIKIIKVLFRCSIQ